MMTMTVMMTMLMRMMIIHDHAGDDDVDGETKLVVRRKWGLVFPEKVDARDEVTGA